LKNILNKEENKGVDSVEYAMEATFFTHIPFKKHVQLTIKRSLPLFHIPEMTVSDMDVNSLRLSGATIQLHAIIKNDNVFPLQYKDIQYVLYIGDKKWAEGSIPGEINIAPKTNTEIVIPAKLDFGEMSKTAFTVLMHANTIDYDLKMNMYLISDKKQINNSKVIFESKGKVKPLLHTLKK
jgi:LEA14-like dessication related protein